MSNDKWKMVCVSLGRRHRRGCRILEVIIANERFGNIDAVGREKNPFNLAAVDD